MLDELWKINNASASSSLPFPFPLVSFARLKLNATNLSRDIFEEIPLYKDFPIFFFYFSEYKEEEMNSAYVTL